MNSHADKTQENKKISVANAVSQKKGGGESTLQFVNYRPEVIVQQKLQEIANKCPQVKHAAQLQAMADNFFTPQKQPFQKKENNTGLPDNLKSGIEDLSGMSLDDVKVHRNSDKPAQLQAYAYAQGTDIHLGPGREKHLPHEAWHVVQQKQGRVKPTMQIKGEVNVNDDIGLEKEADAMGAKAISQKNAFPFFIPLQAKASAAKTSETVQLVKDKDVQKNADITMDQLSAMMIEVLYKISGMESREDAQKEKGQAKGEELADRADEVMYALQHPQEAIKEKAVAEAKKAAKQYWKDLPLKDKAALASEAATAGIQVMSTVASSLTDSGSAPKKSGISLPLFGSKKPTSGDLQFTQVLGEISIEDLQRLYTLMRERGKVREEWKEANSKVREAIKSASGWTGGKIGSVVGSFQDSMMQLRLVSEIKPKIAELKTLSATVEKIAKENEDVARYSEELKELENIFSKTIKGPLSIIARELDKQGLANCKEQAEIAIANLKGAGMRRRSRIIKFLTSWEME